MIDLEKVMPDKKLNIHDGGIAPLGKYKNQMIFWQVEAILKKYECDLKTPLQNIPDEALQEVLYGSLENVRIDKELVHTSSDYFVSFDGIIKYLRNVMDNDDSTTTTPQQVRNGPISFSPNVNAPSVTVSV